MEPETRRLVQALHDCATQLVMVVAGAGTQALSDILGVAGASRTLLEATVPYSSNAFDQFLEQQPRQYVAPMTAKLLAGRAFTRARELREGEPPVQGLACTATIVTDRPKRGNHRAHVAVWGRERLTWHGLYLFKGARDRAGEEGMVSTLMLNSLASACGLPHRLPLHRLPSDRLETDVQDFAAAAAALRRKAIPYFGIQQHGHIVTDNTRPRVLLCGAFNPLHRGHLGMARAAATLLARPVAFEVSAVNVDKPPLSPPALLERLAQFAGRHPVFASNAPTFLAKARLYPGATFVVGFDTARRILLPRYYRDDPAQMLAALAEIKARGNRFVVAGRVDENNAFHTLPELDIPPDHADLFQAIPERLFRADVSSTDLRARGQKGAR